VSLLVGQLTVAEGLVVDIARVLVLVVMATAAGAGVGIVHRWYAGGQVPDGLSVLVGLSVVALYLNTAGALGEVIGGDLDLLAVETAVFNTITFILAAVVASVGGRLGDRIGIGIFAVSGAKRVEGDVSRLVRTVGRMTTVEVPEDIGDIDGYDPVDPATKEALAGQTLVFPRRLTVEELRTRFVERLQVDHGVGHVDVDFADDATIEYLALGGRESGLGATLPPGSAAVAVRADPPNNASPGDVVQVWSEPDPASETGPQRVASAEIRGTADELVTLAMDEPDARRLDVDRRYRLVTLPVEPRADREFASQLRTAEETMGAVTVEAESALAMATVGAVDVAVVAVGTVEGDIVAIPTRHRALDPGETVYAIGRPDRLRKLEAAALAGSAADADADESTE
jgi:hypothetical protein